MFEARHIETGDKAEFYRELAQQLEALLHGETDPIANAANTAALLFQMMPDLNWAGFYMMREGVLELGPFQGRPACVRIAVGAGVCGTAVASLQAVQPLEPSPRVPAQKYRGEGVVKCQPWWPLAGDSKLKHIPPEVHPCHTVHTVPHGSLGRTA